jgi:hypothetical protein
MTFPAACSLMQAPITCTLGKLTERITFNMNTSTGLVFYLPNTFKTSQFLS